MTFIESEIGMHATYETSQVKATTIAPAHALNPRRRRHLELLIEDIGWHGRKIHLDAETYDRLKDERHLMAHQVDCAVDDAYTFGICDVVDFGGAVSVRLLSPNIDDAIRATLSAFNTREAKADRQLIRGRA